MQIGKNLKKLRKQNGLLQKQVAAELGIGISYYSKIENNQREASVEVLSKVARLYGITIDQVVNMEAAGPKKVRIEDEAASEQMRLLAQLEERDRQIVFEIINTMLTRKKFEHFFHEHLHTA